MMIISTLFALLLMQQPLGSGPPSSENAQFRVEARMLGEEYCKGDVDLYTVAVKVDVEVFNTSKGSIFLPKSMVPLSSRVAKSIAEADAGHYLFEASGSRIFPGNYQPISGNLRVEPGKSVVIHCGLDLFARHDASFSYPKSIAPGAYAVVLELGPEMVPANDSEGPQMIVKFQTPPFVVRIPDKPHLTACRVLPSH